MIGFTFQTACRSKLRYRAIKTATGRKQIWFPNYYKSSRPISAKFKPFKGQFIKSRAALNALLHHHSTVKKSGSIGKIAFRGYKIIHIHRSFISEHCQWLHSTSFLSRICLPGSVCDFLRSIQFTRVLRR